MVLWPWYQSQSAPCWDEYQVEIPLSGEWFVQQSFQWYGLFKISVRGIGTTASGLGSGFPLA
jgi:hypothetical protein